MKAHESVKAYEASDINSVENVLEHIRSKSSMYGFSHTQQGVFQLLKEVIDNSIDEAKVTSAKKHLIHITFIKLEGDKFQVVVTDTGRGIPLSKLEASSTKYGTSGKWTSASYTTSIGTFGVGIKATNALSRFFTIISRRHEGFAIVCAEKGVTKRSDISNMHPTDRSLDGVTTIYEPDWSIYKDVGDFFAPVAESGLSMLLEYLDFEATFVGNIRFIVGVTSAEYIPEIENVRAVEDIWHTLHGLRNSPTYKELYASPESISYSKYAMKCHGVSAPILFESPLIARDIGIDGSLGYKIQFFLQRDFSKRGPMLVSAINMIRMHNVKASHVVGTLGVIKKMVMRFIQDTEMRDYFTSYYNVPGGCVIIADWQGASFEGQAKTNFLDNDFLKSFSIHFTKDCERLGEDFWRNYYLALVEDIEERYKRYVNRDIKVGGGLKNLTFSLNNPGCYLECQSRDKGITELFIAEGDSSGDYLKQHRNVMTQAIFKLRGKPSNPFRCSAKELRADDIYQDLVKVLGVGPNDTNLDNMNFTTICIIADADCDGYHIRSLVVGTLYRINPLIVTTGRVLMINPPLYILNSRKHRLFVRDFHALMDLRVEMYEGLLKFVVHGDFANYELSGKAYRDFCYLIVEVGRMINAVATKLIIEPHILESLVSVVEHLNPINPEMIAKGLALDKCEYIEASDSLVITVGNIDTVIHCRDLYSEIQMHVLPVLRAVKWSKAYVTVSTKQSQLYVDTPCTYLQIYRIFGAVDGYFTPNRLKGLAEVPPEQLILTCLDPLTRSYTKITGVGDIDLIYEVFGIDTRLRKFLIQENLHDVDVLRDFVKTQKGKQDVIIDTEEYD